MGKIDNLEKNSGHVIADDFPEVRKIASAGATSKPVKAYELTPVCLLFDCTERRSTKRSDSFRTDIFC